MSSPRPLVRLAGPEDVEELARLRCRMDAEDGVDAPAGFAERFARWYQRHGDRFTVVVAHDGGNLVGTVWLERVERVPRPSEPTRHRSAT